MFDAIFRGYVKMFRCYGAACAPRFIMLQAAPLRAITLAPRFICRHLAAFDYTRGYATRGCCRRARRCFTFIRYARHEERTCCFTRQMRCEAASRRRHAVTMILPSFFTPAATPRHAMPDTPAYACRFVCYVIAAATLRYATSPACLMLPCCHTLLPAIYE